MGLDGGTIITRNDVLRRQCADLNNADASRSSRGGAVRGVLKRRKLDDRTSKVTRWSTCALTGQPLSPPVVACFLGRLYSKASVLEFLLGRAGHFEDEAGVHRLMNQLREGAGAYDHITSIKDVFPLVYTPPAAEAAAAAPVTATADGAADPELPAPYCCPITALRCDRHPFVALRPCGHVFAERAIREAARDGTCPTCSKAFCEAAGDVVPLLPSEEQLERLRELLPERRKQGKQKKKEQKERKRRREGEEQRQEGAEQREEGEERQQQAQQSVAGHCQGEAGNLASAAAAGAHGAQQQAGVAKSRGDQELHQPAGPAAATAAAAGRAWQGGQPAGPAGLQRQPPAG